MLKIKEGEQIPESIIVPTPSFGLNYILGGGFKTGNIHVIWGTPGGGKSTLCLHVLSTLQKLGYHAIIIDTEHSISEQWLVHCGIDQEREVWMGNSVEDILTELLPRMKETHKVAVLIDSINSIESDSFYDNIEASSGMAGAARARRKLLLKVLNYLDPVRNIVLCVSQQQMDFSGYQAKLVAKMGEAEKHWSCNIIRLFSSPAKDNVERDKTDRIINKRVKWTIDKSKQQPVEGTTGYYWLNPVTSLIDKKQELVNIAVVNGVIEKKGAWFYYADRKFQGTENLINQLDDNDIVDLEKILMDKTLVFEHNDE